MIAPAIQNAKALQLTHSKSICRAIARQCYRVCTEGFATQATLWAAMTFGKGGYMTTDEERSPGICERGSRLPIGVIGTWSLRSYVVAMYDGQRTINSEKLPVGYIATRRTAACEAIFNARDDRIAPRGRGLPTDEKA